MYAGHSINPMVSVVIPSYNASREDTLHSLLSARSQTYENIEIVLVDDGSQVPFGGLTPAELTRLGVVAIAIACNGGVSVARNRGWKAASGSLIAFLDSGDWWEPTKLEQQVNALANGCPACGLVYASAIFHEGNSTRTYVAEVDEEALDRLLVGQPITGSASSALVPKSVLESVGGFFEGADIPEDRDLWLRIAKCYRVCKVQEPLVHISVARNSRSADPSKKSKTYLRFLRRHEELIRARGLWDAAMANYRVGIAKKYFERRLYIRGIGWLIMGFLRAPAFVLQIVRRKLRRT